MKNKCLLFFIFLIMFMPICNVNARTLQDMYDELADLQVKYNNNKNSKNLTEKQIKELNNEIDTISANITQTRKDIKQAELDIEESKKKIEDKKLETDGLIQFLQISNGGNIYLEYLFDAENYTDFIYRYEVVKQLTNYNSDLIDELEQLIIDLQNKEKELSAKNIELESQRQELTKKVNTLSYSLSNFQTEGATIEEDIDSLEKVIKIYTDMGCSRNQDISTCAGSIYALGWKYPLTSGCVTSEYTGYNTRTDYSGGGGHHGIDLSCISEGTSIYAAADGVVSRIDHFDCGGNVIYIDHTVNGKQYTTVYMHMLGYASNMYVGRVVTDKTVIGYVGGWSTSIDHGGDDTCTTGTHLHFGIAEGHHAWSFNSYSINPREIYSFPYLIYNGGGYFYR